MACETFLKIVSKCKRKFVIMQVGALVSAGRNGEWGWGAVQLFPGPRQWRHQAKNKQINITIHPFKPHVSAPAYLPPPPPPPPPPATHTHHHHHHPHPLRAAQVGESEPFISELLSGLTATIQDLETHQIHMFYEAVGLMVSADTGGLHRPCCSFRAASATRRLPDGVHVQRA